MVDLHADRFANRVGVGHKRLKIPPRSQPAAIRLRKKGQTDAATLTLGTALNIYATTSSLGGSAAGAYGFTVSATGLGARSFSVGKDGAAFGVANNTTLNVYELLLAVNKTAVKGVLYNGDATLQAQAADLFNALNSKVAILCLLTGNSRVRIERVGPRMLR